MSPNYDNAHDGHSHFGLAKSIKKKSMVAHELHKLGAKDNPFLPTCEYSTMSKNPRPHHE